MQNSNLTYYRKNKDKLLEYHRKCYKDNLDKILERQRKYHENRVKVSRVMNSQTEKDKAGKIAVSFG